MSAETGHRFDDADLELAESLASRAATAVENARLYAARSAIARTLQALAAAAGAARGAAASSWPRVYRAGGRGHRGRRRLLRRLQHRRGPVVRGRRRRLRQGRRGGRGDGAWRATRSAPRPCGGARRRRSCGCSARRCCARSRRSSSGASARSPACTWTSRARPARATVACGGHPLPAILRADGSVEELGTAGHAARPGRAARAARPRRRPAPRRHASCSTRTGSPRRARPQRVWGPAELAEVLRGAAGGSPQEIVDHAVREALGVQPAPRDDIAVVALRARG